MATFVVLHGTFGRGHTWMASLRDALAMRGHSVLPSFMWSGHLGGVFAPSYDDPEDAFDDGRSFEWGAWANHLATHCYTYAPGRYPVQIVAHSHSGQIAAIAITKGLYPFGGLVTLATPVRKDMDKVYEGVPTRLREQNGRWLHVHGDLWRDWMARLGQLFDGDVRWTVEMPHATNLHVKGAGHDPWPLAEAWLNTQEATA